MRRDFYECMAHMILDIAETAQTVSDLDPYKNKLWEFGIDLALRTTSSRTPSINRLNLVFLELLKTQI